MKKFSILTLCIIFNPGMYAAAGSSEVIIDAPACTRVRARELPSFIHIVGKAPDVSARCSEGKFDISSPFSDNHQTQYALACFLVAHEESEMRERILDDIMQTEPYYQCARDCLAEGVKPHDGGIRHLSSTAQYDVLCTARKAHYKRLSDEQLKSASDPFIAAVILSFKYDESCAQADYKGGILADLAVIMRRQWDSLRINSPSSPIARLYTVDSKLAGEFVKQGNVKEICRRYAAGESSYRKTFIEAFEWFLVNRHTFGLAIDPEGISKYIEDRRARERACPS